MLIKPHKCYCLGRYVVVTGGASAPGRSEDPHAPILHDAHHRLIIVEQSAAGDMLLPKAGVGTLSGTAAAQEENCFSMMFDHGSVQLHYFQRCCSKRESDHQEAVEKERLSQIQKAKIAAEVKQIRGHQQVVMLHAATHPYQSPRFCFIDSVMERMPCELFHRRYLGQ